MYARFLNYIKDEELFQRTDRLLLGVSGGVDSVVLASLVEKHGNQFALAHCNFNLRGKESDDDEQFVRDFANQLGVTCYVASFPTTEYANQNGISIEMAARELRYNWFENLRNTNTYDYVLVGHHLDDVLETFLLNLSRGTGIRGLTGIKAKADKIVRPLLFASRNDIEQYAKEKELQFRYDSSNSDTGIKRNLVRHSILPLFQQLNPSFKQNFQRSIKFLFDTEMVFLQKIEEVRNTIIIEEGGWIKIPINDIKMQVPTEIFLYELLRPYNFKTEVVESIFLALNNNPGSKFYSPTHRLVIDRTHLIITTKEKSGTGLYYIEPDVTEIEEPLHLVFSVEPKTSTFEIPKSPSIAVFDFDKISYPMVIRKWQKGEYFRPLGMKHLKKVSDFFIDEKYSIPEKEQTWILASDNKIVWIVGKRVDDRFKITPETQTILKIEIRGEADE